MIRLRLFSHAFQILLMKPDPMGGQALIEGVMMRSKVKISAALRRKDGRIETREDAHLPFRERHPMLKAPVLRGAATLIESLVVGLRYLTWSGDIAAQDEKGTDAPAEKTLKDKALNGLSILFALVVGVGIFMYAPIWLTGFIDKSLNPLLFNLTAGAIRIAFFVAYVWGISLMKDVRRVFEYHGAEHKSIFSYEAGEAPTVANARRHSTRHPRCGTSFLFIAGFACILVFAVVDALFVSAFGPYHSALHRLGVHLLLIPLVSGISFEVLRFSDRHRDKALVGTLILPGLWLQKITTREPDDGELEVALAALTRAL